MQCEVVQTVCLTYVFSSALSPHGLDGPFGSACLQVGFFETTHGLGFLEVLFLIEVFK